MFCQFPEHERLFTSRHWKARTLHRIAHALGVLIHIDGMPYGSKRNLPCATAGHSSATYSTP